MNKQQAFMWITSQLVSQLMAIYKNIDNIDIYVLNKIVADLRMHIFNTGTLLQYGIASNSMRKQLYTDYFDKYIPKKKCRKSKAKA